MTESSPRFFPPDCPADAPRSEREVFTALRGASLPGWHVLHSVAWISPRGGRPACGEADFVLLHPAKGIVVFEVKGGEVTVERGEWFTRPSGQRDRKRLKKSPFKQAEDARFVLQRFLHPLLTERCSFGHAVVFPAGDATGSFGPNAPPEIVIGRSDLSDLAAAIERVCAFWTLRSELSADSIGRVLGVLSPSSAITFNAREASLSLEQEMDLNLDRQLQLTRRQMSVLHSLSRGRRIVVIGGPGTGKSVLALEQARRLAVDGSEILLACSNRALGGLLFDTVRDDPLLHPRCVVRTRVNMFSDLDARRRNPADVFQDPRGRSVVGPFDAIVVDEGQDFHPSELAQLPDLLRDRADGPLYVFADPDQMPWQRGGTTFAVPFEHQALVLAENCRNTSGIASYAERVIGKPLEVARVDGHEPRFLAVSSSRLPATVAEEVRLLLHEGFEPGDIGVITNAKHRLMPAVMQVVKRFGRSPAEFAKGVPWVNKNSALIGHHQPRRVDIGTAREFLSLERRAVVMALGAPGLSKTALQSFLFVGATRARTSLVVVYDETLHEAVTRDSDDDPTADLRRDVMATLNAELRSRSTMTLSDVGGELFRRFGPRVHKRLGYGSLSELVADPITDIELSYGPNAVITLKLDPMARSPSRVDGRV